jgi:hypothetical protein
MSLLQNCKLATAQVSALTRQEAIFHSNLGSWRGDLRSSHVFFRSQASAALHRGVLGFFRLIDR